MMSSPDGQVVNPGEQRTPTTSSQDDHIPTSPAVELTPKSVSSSGTSTPNRPSKFDNLPREKLVAYLKKQMMAQQKSKVKYEAMEKEIKSEKTKFEKIRSDLIVEKEVIQTQLEVRNADFKEKLSELDVKLEKSDKLLFIETNKHKDLQETLECIQSQNVTLTSSYQLLQLEYEESKDKLSPETQITDAEELALARLQLEEWERMMSMLQADRDSAQDHLAKLQLVETTNRGEIGELTEELNLALADRDLANSNSQRLENQSKDNNEISGKLKTLSDRLGEEVNKQQQMISSQKEEIFLMKEHFNESVTSKNDFEVIIETLKKQIEEKKVEKQNLADDAEERIRQFKEQEIQLQENSNAFSNRIKELEESENEYVEKYNECFNKVQELEIKENQFIATSNESSKIMKEFEEKEFEFVKKCDESSDRIRELEERDREYIDKLNESSNRIRELEDKECMSKYKENVESLKDAQHEISELTGDRNTLMLNMARLRDQFDSAVQQVQSLESIQLTLEQDNLTTADKLRDLTEQNQQLIGDRIGVNENSSPGETTELNELRAAAAIHLQASTFAECELTSARAALRRAEHRVDSAAPELVALELKLADMADVRKERDLAADALADARRDLEITSGFANDLKVENEALTSELNTGNVELALIAERVCRLTEENQKYRGQTELALEQYAERTNTEEQLRRATADELVGCEAELVEIRDAFKDATNTIELLKKDSQEKSELIQQIQNGHSENTFTEEEYNNLSDQVKTLTENMTTERCQQMSSLKEKQKNVEDVNLKNTELGETMNELQENLKTLLSGKEEAISLLDHNSITFEKKLNELNLEISNANFDFELYKSDSDIKIEKMKSENIDLVNEIDRLKTDNKQLIDDTDKLELSTKENSNSSDMLEELRCKYEVDISSLNNELSNEKAMTIEHINQLAEKLTQAKTLLETKDEQLQDLENQKNIELSSLEMNSKEILNTKIIIEKQLSDSNEERLSLNKNIIEIKELHQKELSDLNCTLLSSNKNVEELKNELSSISTKAEIIDSNLSVEYKFELSKIKEESSNLIIEKDKEINTYINLMESLKSENIASVLSISSINSELENELLTLKEDYNSYKLEKKVEHDEHNSKNLQLINTNNEINTKLNNIREEHSSILNIDYLEKLELQKKLDQLNNEFIDFKYLKEEEINNKTKMETDSQQIIKDIQSEHVSYENSTKTKLNTLKTEIEEIKIANKKEISTLVEESSDLKMIIQTENNNFSIEQTSLNHKIQEFQISIKQLMIENKGIQEMAEDENKKNKCMIEQLEDIIKLKDKQRIKEFKELNDKFDECKSKEQILLDKVDTLKNASQRGNVYELEIADYEKTVRSLNETIAVKQKCIDERRDIISDSNALLAVSKAENVKLAKKYNDVDVRCKKLKLILMKTKKELAESKSNEMQISEEKKKIESQLQTDTCTTEDWKVKLSDLTSENVKLLDSVELIRKDKERNESAMDEKLNSLNESLSNEMKIKKSITTEYELYKIRVHGVLKQQKTKAQTDEELNEQINKVISLEEHIIRLKEQISNANDHNMILTNEISAITTDRDRMISKLDYIISGNKRRETTFDERFY